MLQYKMNLEISSWNSVVDVAKLLPILYSLPVIELTDVLSYLTLQSVALTRVDRVYFPTPFIMNLAL